MSTLQGGGKRGHRLDAETAAGGLGRLMTGADDNDAQGNRLVVIPALTTRAGNTQDDQQTGQLVYSRATTTHGEDEDRWEAATVATPRTGHSAVEREVVVASIAGGNYGSGNTGSGVPNLVMEPTVRRLTPLECERLQGFTDGWTEGQSDSTRYRQLGNAVAVPVAEWIGARLLEAVQRESVA